MAYVELHVRTNFSFLSGASFPGEYVHQAKALGQPAVAITDCNSVAGVVRAHTEAKKLGQRVLIGAELQLAGGQCLVALPTDRDAYGRLTRVITVGRRRAEKGACELHMEDVEIHGDGTLFICLSPEEPDAAFTARLGRLAERFPGNIYLAANHLYRGDDANRSRTLADIATAASVPLVATNAVTMHVPERRALADVLTCIREKCTIEEAGLRVLKNAERHLKSAEEMHNLFRGYEDAVARTVEVADRVSFNPRPATLRLSRRSFERPRPAGGARAARPRARAGPLYRRRARRHSGRARPRARHHRHSALRALFPHRARHRAVCEEREDSLPGPRVGRQFAGLLLPRHHRVDPDRIDLLFERFVSASATSRRISTSISSMSGARRSSNISTTNTAANGPGLPPRSSPIARAAPCAMSARRSASPTDRCPRSPRSVWGWSRHGHRRERACARSGSIPPIRGSSSCARAGRRADRLPAPSVAACRRLRHHARTARRARADRERGDGRPHRHRMGQGRSRRAAHAEDRCARRLACSPASARASS